MRKTLARGMLALYLAILIWLVLFKLKFNISPILNYHHRSLNLVPFAAPSRVNGKINYGEILFNCLFFIPFGLLLNVNFKKAGFLPKLGLILAFSLTAEITQFIFAIGAMDITDVIANTFGGFLGLGLYVLCNRYINSEKLDRAVISVGAILFVIFISIHVSHFVSMPRRNQRARLKVARYVLGRPKNKMYPSASSISKPLRLSLLSCSGLLNATPFEWYSSNKLSGSAVEIYASQGAQS
jgi:glycopeptide antibiotics resistance protein